MLVLGHEHHGEGAVAVPVGNAFMAAPIRADEAKVLFIKWIRIGEMLSALCHRSIKRVTSVNRMLLP